MSVHRRTNREIEVKLRVPDVAAMLGKLTTLGARRESRVLERNTLYDTPDSDFRRRGALLRIRVETPAPRPSTTQSPKPTHGASRIRRTILTSKAPAALHSTRDRRYKEKLERELVVAGSPKGWDEVLRSLGLRPGFRYDKIRSTFRLSRFPGLAIELDETPVGTFLELEGLPRAIDRAARALGYSSRDYYCGSYWDVYVTNCRRRGITPRNMVFDKQK
jgi:adenylate cyclase, class 2